jgi:hypothetical protein
MANTYTQIHLQLIFGVKYRDALIDPNWETELHKYISEIIMKSFFNSLRLILTNDIFLNNRFPAGPFRQYLMISCRIGEYSVLSMSKKAVCLKSPPLKGLSAIVLSKSYQESGPNGPNNSLN